MAAGDVSVSFPKVFRDEPNDGTVSGGVTIEDGAMKFDGSGDYVDINLATNNVSNKSGTVSLWFNRIGLGTTTEEFIFGSPSGTSTRYYLETTSTGYIQCRFGSGSAQNIGTYNNNTWYHVVLWWDSSSYKCYLNSFQAINGLNTVTTNLTKFSLARLYGWTNYYFNGSIDEVLIYNRSLTADEITQLYNQGRGSYSSVTDGLVAQYSGRDYNGTALLPTKIYDTKNVDPRKEDTSFIDTTIAEARVTANDKFLMVPGHRGQVYVTHIEEAA